MTGRAYLRRYCLPSTALPSVTTATRLPFAVADRFRIFVDLAAGLCHSRCIREAEILFVFHFVPFERTASFP